MSSGFGTKYIPSVSAVTAFEAANIIRFEARQRKNAIEEVKLFQDAQHDSADGLALATKNALDQQADVESQMAGSYIAQGAINLLTPIAGIGFQGYRSNTEELKSINTEADNLNAWKGVLKEDNSQLMGGQPPNNGIPDNAIRDLEQKTFASTHPDQDPTKKQTLEALTARRGIPNQAIDPDAIYEKVSKNIDKEEETNRNKAQSYHATTDRWEQKLNAILQGSAGIAAGSLQSEAAHERKIQAIAEGDKQYAEYYNNSVSQNVQSTQKVFDDTNQTTEQLIQNYYTNLARANQPV